MISMIVLILSIVVFITRLDKVIRDNTIENFVLGVPTDEDEIRNVMIELILWVIAFVSLIIFSWSDIVKFFKG